MFRSGTQDPYPDENLCVYVTQQTGEPAFNDDIALQTGLGMVDLLLSAAPVSNVSGASNAIVMTFSDISNLRTLELEGN